MAATSNPSIRSTRRNKTLRPEIPDRDLLTTHLGKRPHNAISFAANSDIVVPSKKLRSEKILPARPKDDLREGGNTHKQQQLVDIHNHHLDGPPHSSSGQVPPLHRSGRITTAVQPPATGIISANNKVLKDVVDFKTPIDPPIPISHVVADLKPPAESDKRTLRSQDGGSRSKSELSLYFPNYEEFISNEPKETELLTNDTRIYITEEPPKSLITTKTFVNNSTQPTIPTTPKSSPKKVRVALTPSTKPTSPMKYTKVDLEAMIPKLPHHAPDPLGLPIFLKAHRRAERQEKQLKNIEKERAQHEKVQLERIFDGLRGPDWLRVMGISGITEGERKSWEGKRAWCIREVGALLEKFRLWKDEERRRKVEKESHSREDGEDIESNGDDGMANASPASSDVDAMAAMQLHQETLSATTSTSKSKPTGEGHKKKTTISKPTKSTSLKPSPKPKLPTKDLPASTSSSTLLPRPQHDPAPAPPPPPPPPPSKPLTSFFTKAHLRVAALDRTRRTGRKKLAFGQPVPEPNHAAFSLPTDMVTDEARSLNARNRRRARRGAG